MDQWPLHIALIVFAGAGILIAVVGTRLTRSVDQLADRTGFGEAFMGAILLGATTSLPGITASVTAAIDGHPTMALSNAIGGIAAQTCFLAIADMAHRRSNLEHAAASVGNMLSGALLISILGGLMLATVGPQWTYWGIHPITPLMFVAYFLGMRLVYQARDIPMWQPVQTDDTELDEPEERSFKPPLARLWIEFAVCAALVMAAGWGITRAAESIMHHWGTSESLMGGLFIAVTTSLPELITSIAAVRRGALTLAVGGILGGNVFDTLFAAVADIAYRDGSIYQHATMRETSLIAITVIMTSVLLLGLLRRQRKGIGNIGSESALVLLLYIIGVSILAFG